MHLQMCCIWGNQIHDELTEQPGVHMIFFELVQCIALESMLSQLYGQLGQD